MTNTGQLLSGPNAIGLDLQAITLWQAAGEHEMTWGQLSYTKPPAIATFWIPRF